MNKKLNLVEILKDCPEGTKFYSIVHGDIVFIKLLDLNKILFAYKDGSYYDLIIQSDGKLYNNGECIVFPSKDQRDWSKFVAPWYKKDKFILIERNCYNFTGRNHIFNKSDINCVV